MTPYFLQALFEHKKHLIGQAFDTYLHFISQ